MKKNICFLLLIFSVSVLFPSCGGSKKVAVASYPEYTGEGNTGSKRVTKVKEMIDECEKLSLEAPSGELRAYASAIDEDRDFARQQAVLYAKAQVVSDVEQLVLNVMKGYRAKTKKNGVSSSTSDTRQDIGGMAEMLVEGSRIICSNRYALSDGTYECSVCVAIDNPAVEKMAGAAVLSDDEKLGVEFEAQKFRDSYKEELEKYRVMKSAKK
ncbi:MAG: hypothetical protein ACLSC9_06475 [Barnesiella sp.]